MTSFEASPLKLIIALETRISQTRGQALLYLGLFPKRLCFLRFQNLVVMLSEVIVSLLPPSLN